MKKTALILSLICLITLFSACSKTESNVSDGKLRIVATKFPEYDFARQIAGDKCVIDMLLPPGSESHSYEPTPRDIGNIKRADLIICTGGESDTWLENIIGNIGSNDTSVLRFMDICELKEEETVEGMEHTEEDEEETEYDEHVWTSPKNAVLLVDAICKRLCEKDEINADLYRKNADEYIEKINALDREFRLVTENAERKTIVFGDRFPFRYFANEYGLEYFAAFPGCSEDTEPSAKTMKFLIDKIRSENIPVIFKIEFSNGNAAEAISNETGATVLEFHSCHNVTKEQLKNGESYVTLMKANLENLKSALS